MDKTIIFAVAGSGKTNLIIDRLNLEERSLVITYTINNLSNLRYRITKKFGYFPENIRLYSYYPFLYSFCYKPFLALKIGAKGINWDVPPAYTMRLPRTKLEFYMDQWRRLYHNRIAKLMEQANLLTEINLRLDKYFDNLFVDEVQDFAGHDFNLLLSLCQAKVGVILVGDYHQHTFDTSRDGPVNKNLHNNYDGYIGRFKKIGLQIDTTTLSSSYRCSPDICSFISDNIGVEMSSHRIDRTTVELVEDVVTIDEKYRCGKTVKLFIQNHHKYSCYSQNWGASKGENHYEDVCVVLTQNSYKLLKSGDLRNLNPKTKNKLYVACSRARGNLYFIPESYIKKYLIR